MTRALIVQIAGGEQGAKLRSQVTRWHPGATREQVEDAFQEACVRAERSCRGQSEGEVFTWLRTTTHHELGHLRKRAWRARAALPTPRCDRQRGWLLAGANAGGHGRRYLIERELTVMAELEAIVEDYLDQAARWQLIPAAGPLRGRPHRGAADMTDRPAPTPRSPSR